MAATGTTNLVTAYGTIVEWFLGDSSNSAASTSDLYWFSSSGGDIVPKAGATDTSWLVKTITFRTSTASSTKTIVRLKEKDSSGPILFQANLIDLAVYAQTYDPPLRCRPYWGSTDGSVFTTGSQWIFHLV